ncbi:hypothetical protein, partial [Xenorhabdus bovienii]|uniref:hypothetical protein n=1 Tax=Xenorhabdus bovienii TaxID=40576 RepID=UPI0023B30730
MRVTNNLFTSVIVFFSTLSFMPCALAINSGSEIQSTEVGQVQKNTVHQLQVQKDAKEWGLSIDE